MSFSIYADLAEKIKVQVKDELYRESSLRNKFQIRPVEEEETITFSNIKGAIVINEDDSSKTDDLKKRSIFIPFFELACSPLKSLKEISGMSESNIIDFFVSSISKEMLFQEEEIYKTLKKYLVRKNRKGVLEIKTDVQILPACTGSNIGFSVFETLGAAIIKF